MSDFGEEEYKEVTVLAIHMMNIDEIFFEQNRAIEWKKYRFLLTECMEILQGTSGLLDIVMSNNSVYAIYNVWAEKQCVEHAVASIKSLFEKRAVSGGVDEWTLVYGIGIAVGIAIRIQLNGGCGWRSQIWLGNVLKRAENMAQMSICDGRKQMFQTQ